MTTFQLLFLTVIFVAVFGAAIMMMQVLTKNPLSKRLSTISGGVAARADGESTSFVKRIVQFGAPLAKLSSPSEQAQTSAIRTRFMNAGFRHPAAPVIFFAAKTALAAGLPLLVFFVMSATAMHYNTNMLLGYLLGAAALGYYLPNLVLRNIIRLRQREIFENFPDALDLMTVCVEAGLGMDAALARVAGEIGLKSATLSEELHLVTLELRAGSSKERALRNLAMRTGVEDVDALVALLIQAERFGTSIADSLRIQSDQLRTKRRQRAEEQAAKIALKLLFPLIFFIFPSLLVVLMGPAFIQIYRVLLPSLSGGN